MIVFMTIASLPVEVYIEKCSESGDIWFLVFRFILQREKERNGVISGVSHWIR